MPRYPKVMLVLRDYRECLLRHHQSLWRRNPMVNEFLADRSEEQPPYWYTKNIETFDAYPREKLLLYDEDLVIESGTMIPRLSEILGLNPERTTAFIDHLDAKAAQSVDICTSGGRPSATGASRDLRHHARKHLSDAQQLEFDMFYRERQPALFERGLESLCGVGRLTSPTLSPSALLKPEWTTSKNSVRPDAAVHRNRRDEPVELAAPMTLGRHTPGSPVRQGDRSRRHRLHE